MHSDPFLSSNGAYVLCSGYTDPQWRLNELPPSAPVTQGFGEITYPYLLWASPDASGRRQPIPWSADISTALSSSAPGAAW